MKLERKYTSLFGHKVTAQQYLTELVCQKVADLKNQKLKYGFWNDSEWAKFFKLQIIWGSKLIKKYSALSVIKAVKDPANKVYTLRHKSLELKIKALHKAEQKESRQLIPSDTFGHNSTKSTRSKLKGKLNE